MRSVLIYSLVLISIVSFSGCNRSGEKRFDRKDSILVVEKSLQVVLDKNILPKVYYQKPLQVVAPKGLGNAEIHANGTKCLLLPEQTEVNSMIKDMDIFDPIPVVEITGLKMSGDSIAVELIFRATGHNFIIQFKRAENGKLELVKIRERTI